ncbi:hypothetical protein V6N11_066156 [Hibiscus sabdariffa]|uniref:Uncharacterized protein n=1 Tax=Hibiscus sabdariffa TaxID=183260 RepID=A0ABR2AGT8_9ROSI
MGCVSSKHAKKEIKREILLNSGGDYANHVVSLKSSTYGALKLDNDELQHQIEEDGVPETKRVKRSPPREEPEVIDAGNSWKILMKIDSLKGVRNRAFSQGKKVEEVHSSS